MVPRSQTGTRNLQLSAIAKLKTCGFGWRNPHPGYLLSNERVAYRAKNHNENTSNPKIKVNENIRC